MTTIELAPSHKSGLALTNPVMTAAGCFGFGTEYGRLVNLKGLGAIVVGPLTGKRRQGARPPRTVKFSGGVLIHTGLANPGLAGAMRRYARVWARSPVGVIVHLASTSPEETETCCQLLSDVEGVVGIELGLRDSINKKEAATVIQTAQIAADHPLIVRLPLVSAESLCAVAVEAGADALTVAAPPRGTAWHEPSQRFVTGRVYGPFVAPLALHAVRRVAERVTVPLIGCGGIHTAKDARSFLQAGALAIQVDSGLWNDPRCLARIALGLSEQ